MKYKSLEEIQKNPVWLKLQSKGTEKKQLDKVERKDEYGITR